VSVWIADSGPVILLGKADRLTLLTDLSDDLLLTETVDREIRRGDAADPARKALLAGFGTVVPGRYIPVALRPFMLDPGERSVLALALKNLGCTVVLDDRQARRVAGRLGIACIGTLGVVLRAKQQGFVPEAGPIVRGLLTAGMFLDMATIQAALAAIGETWP
jgi:hypothetical protein